MSTAPSMHDQSAQPTKPPTLGPVANQSERNSSRGKGPRRCYTGAHTPPGACVHCLQQHKAPAQHFDLGQIMRYHIHNDGQGADRCQGAYRCHRSTNDNIFILYAMIQKYLTRKGGRFYCTFVDFSIPHQKLWYRLISEGIHGRILKLLRYMYSKFKSCVKTSGGLTEWFDRHQTRMYGYRSPLYTIY